MTRSKGRGVTWQIIRVVRVSVGDVVFPMSEEIRWKGVNCWEQGGSEKGGEAEGQDYAEQHGEILLW